MFCLNRATKWHREPVCINLKLSAQVCILKFRNSLVQSVKSWISASCSHWNKCSNVQKMHTIIRSKGKLLNRIISVNSVIKLSCGIYVNICLGNCLIRAVPKKNTIPLFNYKHLTDSARGLRVYALHWIISQDVIAYNISTKCTLVKINKEKEVMCFYLA